MASAGTKSITESTLENTVSPFIIAFNCCVDIVFTGIFDVCGEG